MDERLWVTVARNDLCQAEACAYRKEDTHIATRKHYHAQCAHLHQVNAHKHTNSSCLSVMCTVQLVPLMHSVRLHIEFRSFSSLPWCSQRILTDCVQTNAPLCCTGGRQKGHAVPPSPAGEGQEASACSSGMIRILLLIGTMSHSRADGRLES